jgi:hypothetical protein
LLKIESSTLIKLLTNLCNKIVLTGDFPKDWLRSEFIMIPKVTDNLECDEHRIIALISHASKILLRILLNRKEQAAEKEISDVQMGFR